MFFAELAQRQDCSRVLEDLQRHDELKVVNVHCCFLVRMHFSIGCNHCCRVSGKVSSSAKFRSFLLSLCIDAPECNVNYLWVSSNSVRTSACRHFSTNMLLSERIVLVSRFFLYPILKLWRKGAALLRFTLLNNSLRCTPLFPAFL